VPGEEGLSGSLQSCATKRVDWNVLLQLEDRKGGGERQGATYLLTLKGAKKPGPLQKGAYPEENRWEGARDYFHPPKELRVRVKSQKGTMKRKGSPGKMRGESRGGGGNEWRSK